MKKAQSQSTVAEATKTVTILRTGNRVVIDPSSDRVRRVLEPELSFEEKIQLRGAPAYEAAQDGKPVFYSQTVNCFDEDHRKRLSTNFGFVPRIRRCLRQVGYKVFLKDLTPPKDPTVFEPDWSAVNGAKFREGQREALELITKYEHGRIECPTGWGKTWIIIQVAKMFPKARIAVITRRVTIMNQRIYPELCLELPNVGRVGGGPPKRVGSRVMCYTAGSIQHSPGDEDFVFFDEGHEAAADDCAFKMAVFDHARMWSFSATWDMRLDGKDKRCEAMFGPIRMRVTYSQAVAAGMVVPIEVIWSNVVLNVNPAFGEVDVEKKRLGLWTNEERNKIIAKDARRYPDDVQVLIVCDTLEHLLHLKKLLPEFEIVYAGQSQKPADLVYYRKQKLIDDDFELITQEQRDDLTRRFTKGTAKKVIATTVWNVGVDFKRLAVLIRADGGASPINDTQIPGRASRLHSGKAVGIVHDYKDQFDPGLARRADKRAASYEILEWVQHPPEKKLSVIRALLAEKGT